MIDLGATHRFHPVGQGLFYTGRLDVTLNATVHTRCYRWAYDCGTHSAKCLIDREVERVVPIGMFDLLVLSHFDADHVSGVGQLISATGVRTVMLPYMPLWERLLIAFDQGFGATDEITFFYINPAAYLASLGSGGPERVIFVPRSDDGEPNPTVGHEPSVDPWPERPELPSDKFETLEHHESKRLAPDFDAMAKVARDLGHNVQLEMLRKGGSGIVLGLWEFVPYNDPKVAPSSQPAFEQEVANRTKTLLAAKNANEAKTSIDELREVYDRHIGRGNRNRASLFLYGGPLLVYNHAEFVARNWSASRGQPTRLLAGPLMNKRAILLTGDGTLRADEDFDQFGHWFGKERMSRIAVLQVMHHGAKSNTKPGRARQLDPSIAVFSSDPSRRRPGHPHDEVAKDFLLHSPYQADQHAGVDIDTWFVSKSC